MNWGSRGPRWQRRSICLAGGHAIQDSAYRWWPRTREPLGAGGAAAAPRTLLANLCRYYLECLSRESGPGISIPAASADVDYVVLDELPFARSAGTAQGNERAIRKIVQKAQRERGQLALYIGYAIRLRPFHRENRTRCGSSPCCSIPWKERLIIPPNCSRRRAESRCSISRS